MNKTIIAILLALATSHTLYADVTTVGYEDTTANIPDYYWPDTTGLSDNRTRETSWMSGSVSHDHFATKWAGSITESWFGWAWSSETDTTFDSFRNQYSSYTGTGAAGTNNYVVMYDSYSQGYFDTYQSEEGVEKDLLPMEIEIPSGYVPACMYATNTVYTGYLLGNDDPSGYSTPMAEGDWFKLTMTGYNSSDDETGVVEFFLADGTDVVEQWRLVDLTPLGSPSRITFALETTDLDEYESPNTPFYAALDELVLVPEGETPGDINGSGMIDGEDLNLLLSNWDGSGVGDITGDGLVGEADFFLLTKNYGSPVASVSATVPEPSSIILITFALLSLMLTRKRK